MSIKEAKTEKAMVKWNGIPVTDKELPKRDIQADDQSLHHNEGTINENYSMSCDANRGMPVSKAKIETQRTNITYSSCSRSTTEPSAGQSGVNVAKKRAATA